MPTQSTRRLGLGAAALVAVGALAASASSQSGSNTLPARTPTDARAANLLVHTTTVPVRRVEANRASSYRIGRNGPTVRVGPTRTRQFTGFQQFTVTPPSGRDIFQGFATVSGGNSGVFQIRQTRVVNGRYIVNVAFPGEQGTNGRLTIRVQSLPDDE